MTKSLGIFGVRYDFLDFNWNLGVEVEDKSADDTFVEPHEFTDSEDMHSKGFDRD